MNMKKVLTHKGIITLLFLYIMISAGIAQPLDGDNRLSVTLSDGTEVTLLGKAKTTSNVFTGEYYYLPTGLRLSSRPDGVPEFLFMKYTTEEGASAGGVQGALLHFLMQWGLTTQQETELLAKVKAKLEEKKKDPVKGRLFKPINSTGIKIMGPVDVQPLSEGSFQIYSASLSDPSSAKLITSGRAPSLEGGKAVVASKMDANTAQLMATSFEDTKSIADLSVTLGYQYNVMMPAIDASVIINWTKVSEVFDSLSTVYEHSKKTRNYILYKKSSSTYSYDEMHEVYQSTIDRKAVRVNIVDQSLGDETSAMILEAFMSYFTNALTDRDMEVPSIPADGEKDDTPNNKKGNYYTYNKVKAEKKTERGIETISLKYRRAVPRFIDVTGNLRSWYDGVKDNESCVASVTLNDPFFQHRNINFILDMDAEGMFGQAVNYVTVAVRKKRSSGNDFSDSFTIDKKYVNEKGTSAMLTYARGDDSNPDVFEYKAQWSLRGGKVYPESPTWQKGDWEGVTLAAPVIQRTIMVDSDIEELKAKEIGAVTAQVRYKQFGEEKETNIMIIPSKGESFVEKNIFIDKNTNGYAYRLVITHKAKGKFALPWEVKMNDDYIYTTIPEEMADSESKVYKEAKQEAQDITSKAKEKVLDKFEELFN